MLSNCHEVFINIYGQGLELFVHVNIIITNRYVNWAQTDLELKLIHNIVLSNITDWSSWVTQFGRHNVVVNISFQSYLSSVKTSFVQCNSLPPSFLLLETISSSRQTGRRCHCGRFSCLAVVSDRESGVTLEWARRRLIAAAAHWKQQSLSRWFSALTMKQVTFR